MVLKREDFTIHPAPPKKRKTRSLDELLSNKQLERHTKLIWLQVCSVAEDEGLEVWQLMGVLLKRCKNQKANYFGCQLWDAKDSSQPPPDPHIQIDTAMAIYVDSSLGCQTYTNAY